MDSLKWIFELRDKITGPARRATGGLKQLRDELRGGTRELDRFSRGRTGAGGLPTMVRGLGVAVGLAGGLYLAFRRVAGVVADVAESIGGIVARFAGGVIEAGASRMRALTGMRALVGEGAEDALRQAEELSDFLGTDLHETVSSIQSLMAQGFQPGESRTLFQALADLQTINPAANIQGLTLAIGQIHSKGRLMGEELMQLTEAGLNRGAVLEQIGAARGLSGDDVVRQVEQLMQHGEINEAEAMRAILGSIRNTTGMEIGGLARQASEGLPGMLARLQQAPARMFNAIAADSTGAFASLHELLRDVLGLLDPGSQGFRDFVAIASEGFGVVIELLRTAWDVGVAFFSGLFGEASESTDPIEDIRAGLQDVRGWLASLRETGTLDEIRGMGAGFAQLAVAVWPVVKALLALVAVVGSIAFAFINLPVILAGFAAWFANFIAEGRLQAVEWGRALVEGITMGMRSGVASIQEAAGGIRDRVVGAVEGAFEMHSPSRVMAELGAMAAEGFDRGLGGLGPVTVPPPELGAGVGESNRAAAGGPSLTFNIEVNGAGDAQATAQAVHEVVLESLREVFGRAAGEYRGAFG